MGGGYLFVLVYGSESDWVRNVLAAGRARLTVDGEDVGLTTPRLLHEDEAWQVLPDTVKRQGPPTAPPGRRTRLACVVDDVVRGGAGGTPVAGNSPDVRGIGYRRVRVRWVTPLGDATASMS